MSSANHVKGDVEGEKNAKHETTCRDVCCYQLLAIFAFAAGLAGGVVIGIYVYHGGPNAADKPCLPASGGSSQSGAGGQTGGEGTTAARPENNEGEAVKPGECPKRNPVTNKRYEDTVYAPLTSSEMQAAASFLLTNGVISTLDSPTDLTQNFILYQWLDVPTKSDALQYLDANGVKPRRHSRVTVQRGREMDVMEYRVGPLDSNAMTVTTLTSPGDVHFNSRPYDGLEVEAMTALLEPEMDILAPLIAESFDGARYPDDIMFSRFNGPPSTSGKDRDTSYVIILLYFKSCPVLQ